MIFVGSSSWRPSRRRRVLLGLMAVISAVVGVCAVDLIPWWSVAIPGGLLLIFFVVARISVHQMRKSLDARYREITQGSDETTVFLSRKEMAARVASATPTKITSEDAKPGRVVGSGPDHHADLRVEAARAAYRPHHRPLRSRRHLIGPPATPGHRRRDRSRRPVRTPDDGDARQAASG